jgi:mono/diheme cytochrome c family protein
MTRRLAVAAGAAVLLLAGCGRDEAPAPAAGPAPSDAGRPAASTAAAVGDQEKGRQIYLGQCVACHNRDPAKDGPLGPALKGSPHELVETRVLHGTYPPGYTPKRNSKVMPPRPDLAPSIPDLAAYLR